MHNVTLKLYWIYARARVAIQAKGHIQYCLVGSIDLPRHCHLKGPYYRDLIGVLGPYLYFRVPIFSVLASFMQRISIQSAMQSLHEYNNELTWSVCDE